jgi:hypothetical protein
VTLASLQTYPDGIAVTTTDVYWTDLGNPAANEKDGALMSVPIGGGAVVTLAAGQTGAESVAVGPAGVYWTTSSAVVGAPLAGGTPTTLATTQTQPWSIAVAGTSVYWFDTGGSYFSGTLQSVPVSGGTPTTLATKQGWANSVYGFAVDATSIYWANFDCPIDGGVCDGDGAILKTALGGGGVTTLASGQNTPNAVAVAAGSVYWTTEGTTLHDGLDGTVMRGPVSGGPATMIAQGGVGGGIAVDAASVYWTSRDPSSGNESLVKAPIAGGSPVTMAADVDNINSFTIDAHSIYWTTSSANGTVMRLTPK